MTEYYGYGDSRVPGFLGYCYGLLPFTSSGPGCLKLTTSLVNVLLKFQTLVSQIRQYFC